MKNIIILAFVFCGMSAKINAQDFSKTSMQIINEVKSFIDTVKPMSIFNGKYNVYVFKINSTKICDSQFVKVCFTISHISNDYNLDYIDCNYHFSLESEIVLLGIKDKATLSLFKEAEVKKIDSSNIKFILAKLANPKERMIRGTPKSEVVTIESNTLTKTFYRDSDQMPKELSVFDIDRIMNGIEFREVPHPELPSDHPKNQMR